MFVSGELACVRRLGLWLLFVPLIFIAVKCNGVTDNKVQNTLLLFQDVALSDWNNANKTAVLQRFILDVVNGFCSQKSSTCSLNFWNESRKFNSRHVIVAESPKQEDKDILVKVFVALPDGKDIRKDGHSAIAGSVLREILLSHKQNISLAVGAEVKSIDIETDSNNRTTDNVMNYIMIPVTFAVLVMLCCMAFCLHSASKRRQKANEEERRKQMRLNKLGPSTADDLEGQAQNTAGAVTTTDVHEKTRKQKRRKHQDNDESGERTRKRKKTKHGKHRRLEEETVGDSAMLGAGQLERRERVPTPIPEHHGVNKQKRTRKKKQQKNHRELREHDEGYSEGSSETRQAAELMNSEELLIKSLPRPRQLAPLPERTDIQL